MIITIEIVDDFDNRYNLSQMIHSKQKLSQKFNPVQVLELEVDGVSVCYLANGYSILHRQLTYY